MADLVKFQNQQYSLDERRNVTFLQENGFL